jgi:TolB-like protein/Tfp pilus assembly protein PilF
LLVSILAWRRMFAAPSTSTNRALLAVLPFQNLNNDPAQDYFADGLTAEMISRFGRLPTDRLGVIAWASMMRYKGVRKSEEEVGRELGANYVLEGTVRREGEHVRITAELVKTGERGHIWANSYDGDLTDVLALQTRVAQEIAGEIQARMNPERFVTADSIEKPSAATGAARPKDQGPVNAEGYDAYLRGKALTDEGRMIDTAAEHLERAIALNPNYAPPYITLAMYYRMQASWEFAPSKSSYAKAKAAALKALELDPGSGAPHRELAWIDWRGDWNFAEADKEYRLAVQIDPGDAGIHEGYSLYLKSMGRYEEALREIEVCVQLSPMQAISHANAGTVLGLLHRYDAAMEEFAKARKLDDKAEYVYRRMGAVLLWQGKNQEAIETFQKAVVLSKGRPEALAWLAYAYAVGGTREGAQEVFDELLRNAGKAYASPFYMGMVYAGFGDEEKALAWLEKAYEAHDEWMVYLKIYPEFTTLHGDPRFQDMERRVGLL